MKTIKLTVYEITELTDESARERAFYSTRAEIVSDMCDELLSVVRAFAKDLDWYLYQPADLRAAAESAGDSYILSAVDIVLTNWRGDMAEPVGVVRGRLIEAAYQIAREWSDYPENAAPDGTVIDHCDANGLYFTADGSLFSGC